MQNLNSIGIGKLGEKIASTYLIQKGLKIEKMNFRSGRFGEIDIIAEDKGTLVFVEVKTRRTLAFGRPEEAVNKAKLRKMEKAALFYVSANSIEKLCRFDVVAVYLMESHVKIEHFKNVLC